jgi:L-histidine N-alpha-methyltransferase
MTRPGPGPARSSANAHLATRATFAADVRRGLTARPKRVPPSYFYDDLGFRLFEAICRLPWYPITRAEHRLLERHSAEIVRGVGGLQLLVELGCGDGAKLGRLLDALGPSARPLLVHLVDLSAAALAAAVATLGGRAGVSVVPHQAPYEDGLREALGGAATAPVLVLFLGSNLGNFEPDSAAALLADIRAALGRGGGVLLGVDLVKPVEVMLAAYDDPLGVTAAFNKNLLVRINRELGAEFDPTRFDHRVLWDAAHSRIEMHLVSRVDQTVVVPGAGCTARFAAGESIWTESSYKYEPATLAALAATAGLELRDLWIDDEARFALAFLRPV